MLQWTKGCICLLELVFLFSLGKYPEERLLYYMAVVFLIFWGTLHTFFHNGCTNLQSHQLSQCPLVQTCLPPFSHPLPFFIFLASPPDALDSSGHLDPHLQPWSGKPRFHLRLHHRKIEKAKSTKRYYFPCHKVNYKFMWNSIDIKHIC